MRISVVALAAGFATIFFGAETIRFDGTPPGSLPGGWSEVASHGNAAKWEILRDPTAPSKPNVLAPVSRERHGSRYPLAILNTVNYRNGEVSVKFKPVAGKAEQVAGLVWRYRDPENYYLVRANALENNIVMYKIEAGRWTSLTPKGKPPRTYGVNKRIPSRAWSLLKVSFKNDRFEVYFDHRKVLEAEDSTFEQPGKIGLWTKADSVTYFDDFQFAGK
jgi:hypothetical protein